MEANVGGRDRSLRIIGGLVLVDLALAGLVGAWAWIGLLPLATGVLAWCPLYLPSGLSTMARARGPVGLDELREAVALQAHSTVRPRTLPSRNSSSA